MKFTAVLALFLGIAAAAEITASTGIKSAIEGPCVYLDETQKELNY